MNAVNIWCPRAFFEVVNNKLGLCIALLIALAVHNWAMAADSNVSMTKHNLSVAGPGSVQATSESQVCVFCHTPHGANTANDAGPLWNRELSPAATYTMYDSLSLDANDMAAAPGGASKLCLSCHDGTLAIGSVNVANGQQNVDISMQGTAADGSMPDVGSDTGFTRNLGTDLSNDHPISFTFNTSLATADGELRDPNSSSHLGDRLPGSHPTIPLENGKVQCISCHDPHIWDETDPNRKFLRANRMQKVTPSGGNFSEANDQICIACHDKMGQAWAMSVHANSVDANETYTDGAADLREFPRGTKVWQAGCLNCHDTHTVQGSRRLLREGVDSAGGITTAKTSGNPAIEETCYQCHRPQSQSVLTSTNNNVPDIYSDFTSLRHMPITNNDQQKVAVHNISDADFSETRANIGRTNKANRHVECSDCHNPHRVMKDEKFNGNGSQSSGTHAHRAGVVHSNIASGALKGSLGVEPIYSNDRFETNPSLADSMISFQVKKGNPSSGASDSVNASYVTREYQVCLRCHSNYGFGATPPALGESGGGTPNGTNGVSQYTNQAMEFQAPQAHKGEGTAGGLATNNHRSWHPVMAETGRTSGVRGANANSWRAPWNEGVGSQTMYCSDCHGNNTATTTSEPTGDNAWGPHGSNNNFVLKGPWAAGSESGSANPGNNLLCFRCHDGNVYAGDGGGSGGDTGFCCGGKGNLHRYHRERSANYRCSSCHVALPHGWKNKALLVNLNDVGPEGGQPEGTNVGGNSYSNGPYYQNARLRILNWRQSGTWREQDCGKSSRNSGKEWMENTCGRR
ncbi:hypothetical protein [Thalassotalea aquiviva]|uniref:hypothetical protein n=1 Tax=Thalassotalea aquiviva TaxID=3242415 RepID=UPI00352AA7EE